MRIHSILLVILPIAVVAQPDFYKQLADSAETLTKDHVVYDPSYFSIDFPNGDVPADKGVCTDVVIRAYRKVGIDLQKLVHDDMKQYFQLYPQIWGLAKPDKNIDHRRVPNLMKYFERNGITLEVSYKPEEYQPGDIVCWNLGGSVTHIGIVTDELSTDRKRFKIIHNIGNGQVIEDILFSYSIIGHYRFGE